MVQTARQRVVSLLRHQSNLSAEEIGRDLDLSAATVRHHLSILRSDGRVVRSGARGGGQRGRPSVLYRLSDTVLGDGCSRLLDHLLRAWPGRSRAAAEAALAAVLAKGLSDVLEVADEHATAAHRLRGLVEHLNAAHYEAKWEAGPQGPRILLGHCPYAAVIEGHPILCEMDRRALSGQLAASVRQLAKIDFEGGTVTKCVFQVQ